MQGAFVAGIILENFVKSSEIIHELKKIRRLQIAGAFTSVITFFLIPYFQAVSIISFTGFLLSLWCYRKIKKLMICPNCKKQISHLVLYDESSYASIILPKNLHFDECPFCNYNFHSEKL